MAVESHETPLVDELCALYMSILNGASDTSAALEERLAFYTEFRWLARLHTNDCFAEDVWNTTPLAAWRESIDRLTVGQLLSLPFVELTAIAELGLDSSLETYIRRTRELAIYARWQETSALVQAPLPLSSAFVHGMHPKKLHEVATLGPFTARFGQAVQQRRAGDVARPLRVIDLGSGKGYVSQLLAFEFGLDVACVEGNPAYHASALERMQKYEHYCSRKRPAARQTAVAGHITPIACHLPVQTPYDAFADMLRAHGLSFGANDNHANVLLGLHTCGDLASTILRLTTADCACIDAVVVVPCCYNLLTAAGFPTSRLLTGRLSLGLEERNLAAQNLPKWQTDYDDSASDFAIALRKLMFRSLIEPVLRCEILAQQGEEALMAATKLPDGRSAAGYTRLQLGLGERNAAGFPCVPINALQLVSQSKRGEPSCAAWAEQVFAHIGLAYDRETLFARYPPLACADNAGAGAGAGTDDAGVVDPGSHMFRRFIAFFALRTMISPVLEALILLDHVQFLHESTVIERAGLAPLFDPAQSPRSACIWAVRKGPVTAAHD